MTPRIIFFTIAGIIVYVALSLYHWGQVKNIPAGKEHKGGQPGITRESREKNWVQVTTSSGLKNERTVQSSRDGAAPADEQNTPLTATSSPGASPGVRPPVETDSADSREQQSQAVHTENKELRQALQHERSINQRQSREIEELHTQILSLNHKLEDTSARLQEKNADLEALRTEAPGLTDNPGGPVTEDKRVHTLKAALASRLDALEKANERITGLAERLDRTRRTLAEAEKTNTDLQNLLSDTESARIRTIQEVDRLHGDLKKISAERERYLAETGRLQTQLRQERNRTARLEKELSKARLASEAMLRYGQEQSELINPFRQQIEILNARVADKNSELLKAEENVAQFRDQEKSLQDKIASLQLKIANNEGLSSQLQEASRLLNTSQNHSAELTEQLKVLADQLNTKELLANNLRKELADARNASREAEQRAGLLHKETMRQQKELADSSQAIAALEQQFAEAAEHRQNLENELTATRKENGQREEKIAEMEKLLIAARAESTRLAAGLKEKDALLAEAENALIQSRAAIAELETASKTAPTADQDETITQLQKALQKAESRLADADSEISRLNNSLAAVENSLSEATAPDELQLEIDQLRQTVEDNNKRSAAAELLITGLQSANSQLQEDIRAAEQEMINSAERSAILERKAGELDRVRERLTRLENETIDLEAELDRRETTFFSMQEEYSSLQDQFTALQKERDRLLLYTMDSDNDTVPDAEDRCPGTVGGAEVDREGCERDRDGDGLVDRLDLCPQTGEAGGINPFGCGRGSPIVLSGIYFSGGNTDLSPSSQAYLDKVAAVLKGFADVRFEVGGHTDSIGDAARNQAVSRQRAQSVTDYLVAKGIDADRLEPAGYGPGQPLADNSSPEGRAANRRVELKIIPADDSSVPAETEKPTATEEKEG